MLLSINDIAVKHDKSKGSVRYWLKKYKLKTIGHKTKQGVAKPHLCECGEDNKNNFYGKRKTKCKKCCNMDSAITQRNKKLKFVSICGGKCAICGYSKSISALQFHHLNPAEKDKGFDSFTGWSNKRIKNELDNCILLCANCHAEEHEKIRLI